MFPHLTSLFGFCFLAVTVPGAATDRLDQLFTAWEEAQRDVHSLVVTFTEEIRDPVLDTRQQLVGTLKLLRTDGGDFLASYHVHANGPTDTRQQHVSGLLYHGAVYLLDHDQKTAVRFEAADHDLLGFLDKYFNPFVLLLDSTRAQEAFQLKVTKQDEWYTYVTVKPKQPREVGWSFSEGRAVFMNRPTDTLPVSMPKQLWYRGGSMEYWFEIKEWKWNGPEAPKRSEFKRPEDRPGWEVLEW